MTVSTMVDTAKKNYAVWYCCLCSSLRKKQIDESVSKVANVMKFLYFYENFFRFTKKFLPIFTLQGFF